jgi:hypothetical protein
MFPASMTIRTGRRSFALSLNSPIDAEAELQIRLHQTGNRLLRAIEEALGRIRQGTYEICGVCNQPISRSRLEAVPWTHTAATARSASSRMVLWREDHESLHRRCGGTWQVARKIASLPGVKMADACCGSRDVFAVVEVAESQ